MENVPGFSDLGKSARDVFKTGYHYGKSLFKLTVKSQKTDVFDMSSDLALNFDTSKVKIDGTQLDGMLETKYKTESYGNLMQKWTTEGTGYVGYESTGKLFEGLSLIAEFFYNPQTTIKGTKFDAKYANESINGVLSLANDNFDPNVNIYGGIVTSYKEVLLGYQCAYKTSSKELTKNDVAMAFPYRDFAFHLRCTSIPHEFGCSVLYKVNDDWDIAMNGISAKSGTWHQWTIGVAAKYKLDENSTLRFKLNSGMQLATSLEQKLSDHATIAMSFNLDCANLSRGSHKIGMALALEA